MRTFGRPLKPSWVNSVWIRQPYRVYVKGAAEGASSAGAGAVVEVRLPLLQRMGRQTPARAIYGGATRVVPP